VLRNYILSQIHFIEDAITFKKKMIKSTNCVFIL